MEFPLEIVGLSPILIHLHVILGSSWFIFSLTLSPVKKLIYGLIIPLVPISGSFAPHSLCCFTQQKALSSCTVDTFMAVQINTTQFLCSVYNANLTFRKVGQHYGRSSLQICHDQLHSGNRMSFPSHWKSLPIACSHIKSYSSSQRSGKKYLPPKGDQI